MKKEKNTPIFIEVEGAGGEPNLVNLQNVQNIRSTIDNASGKPVQFIYFEGPGAYCKVYEDFESLKKKIKEATK